MLSSLLTFAIQVHQKKKKAKTGVCQHVDGSTQGRRENTFHTVYLHSARRLCHPLKHSFRLLIHIYSITSFTVTSAWRKTFRYGAPNMAALTIRLTGSRCDRKKDRGKRKSPETNEAAGRRSRRERRRKRERRERRVRRRRRRMCGSGKTQGWI